MIDDNAVNRKLASVMLRKRGWSVDEAEDGFIGLDKLRAKSYDHVLLDINSYRQYVQDEWSWKRAFDITNSSYK